MNNERRDVPVLRGGRVKPAQKAKRFALMHRVWYRGLTPEAPRERWVRLGDNDTVPMMKTPKHTSREWHLWLGLPCCLIMFLYAVSGLILQHDDAFSGLGVSRDLLPDSYRLEHWNNGLMRGTVRAGKDVFAYGAAGVYRTTPEMKDFSPAMDGLPQAAEVRDLAAAADGRLFCATGDAAYTLAPGGMVWTEIKTPKKMKPGSLCLRDGDLYLVGRSSLARAQAPYATAEKLDTPPPADAPQGCSMLGLVKDLHHGKLLGTAGIVLVDIIAVVFIVLCISGFLYWLLRMLFPRLGSSLRPLAGSSLKLNLSSHRFLGRWTLWGLVLVTVTGWFLMKPLRGAVSFNLPVGEAPSWLGKAPALRYDASTHDFLVAGSAGLYSLSSPSAAPARIAGAPKVSGKGVPVMLQLADGSWIVGSSEGLYKWNRSNNTVETLAADPVAGYTVECGGLPISSREGAPALEMPASLAERPLSLKQFAKDLHTGKILLGAASGPYVFVTGLVSVICLLTGWLIVRRRK